MADSSKNIVPPINPSAFQFPVIRDMYCNEGFKAAFSVMMPCVVTDEKYDRKTHLVTVQPLARVRTAAGWTNWPLISCTVWRPFACNYFIDIPVKQGDTGWIIASDRDTSVIKQQCRPQKFKKLDFCEDQMQNSNFTHEFSWGIFIPDRWGEYGDKDVGDKLDEEDEKNERLVIQACDASQRISIGKCDIKVFATNVTVNTTNDCVVNAEGDVSLNSDSDINLNAEDGVIKMTAQSVIVEASEFKADTDTFVTTSGGGFEGAANGTISSASVAKVQNGVIVSIAGQPKPTP